MPASMFSLVQWDQVLLFCLGNWARTTGEPGREGTEEDTWAGHQEALPPLLLGDHAQVVPLPDIPFSICHLGLTSWPQEMDSLVSGLVSVHHELCDCR